MDTYIRKIYLNKNRMPVRIINEDGETEIFEYDNHGNVIRHNNSYYAYDQNNNLIYKGNYCMSNIYYIYEKGLLIFEISYNSGKLSIIKYEYDKYGNIIYERDKDSYIEYKYDNSGHLAEKLYFDKELIEFWNNYLELDYSEEFVYKYSELYDYDNNGRLLTIIDHDEESEDSIYQEYKYDKNGNIIYFYDSNEQEKQFYEYDENNNIIKEIREGDGTTPEDNIIIIYEYYDED